MASSKPYLGLLLSISCLVQLQVLLAAPYQPPRSCDKSDREMRFMFSQWMSKYSKQYPSPEEQENRYQVWKDNTNFIGTFRSQTEISSGVGAFAPQTITDSFVGMNRFGDLTSGEFVQQFTGFNDTGFRAPLPSPIPPHSWLPCCVDWRSSGAVTGVKFQGSCVLDRQELVEQRLGRPGLRLPRQGRLVAAGHLRPRHHALLPDGLTPPPPATARRGAAFARACMRARLCSPSISICPSMGHGRLRLMDRCVHF
ncbi:hypothetical protein E2562_006219 [Oryza meyeriana var. granulata]|uniref:Cathepsin propeptide inhibitor domain-containing protein n=1 Tax=Oryza meyeriana var. granulata TaxID=110450 RepID=A0A6G1CQ22_9ORYZ|nr:hypothetical protein E2562_006219 [Oryza meyeriana var. granulata]